MSTAASQNVQKGRCFVSSIALVEIQILIVHFLLTKCLHSLVVIGQPFQAQLFVDGFENLVVPSWLQCPSPCPEDAPVLCEFDGYLTELTKICAASEDECTLPCAEDEFACWDGSCGLESDCLMPDPISFDFVVCSDGTLQSGFEWCDCYDCEDYICYDESLECNFCPAETPFWCPSSNDCIDDYMVFYSTTLSLSSQDCPGLCDPCTEEWCAYLNACLDIYSNNTCEQPLCEEGYNWQ